MQNKDLEKKLLKIDNKHNLKLKTISGFQCSNTNRYKIKFLFSGFH